MPLPEAQRLERSKEGREGEKGAYALGHWNLVNDFDLSPESIWKLLHSFKLAGNTIKCRLSKDHSFCLQGERFIHKGRRNGRRSLQAVQLRDSGYLTITFYFLYSNALTSGAWQTLERLPSLGQLIPGDCKLVASMPFICKTANSGVKPPTAFFIQLICSGTLPTRTITPGTGTR